MKILFNLVSYVHTEVEITGCEYVTFWPLSSLDRLASNSGTSISLHITSIQVCFTFTAAICAMHVLKYQTQHKWPADRAGLPDLTDMKSHRHSAPSIWQMQSSNMHSKETCYMLHDFPCTHSPSLSLSLSLSIHPAV